MPTGTDSWDALGVPLFGDFELKNRVDGTDNVTLTAASGDTGDFLVCRNNAEVELFVINASGVLDLQGVTMTTGQLDLSGGGELILELEQFTTAPSTGLTTGQLYLYTAANVVTIGVADGAGTQWRVALTNN